MVLILRGASSPKHSYQERKSAETVLVEVVTEIEKVIKSVFALSVVLDIKGALMKGGAMVQGISGRNIYGKSS